MAIAYYRTEGTPEDARIHAGRRVDTLVGGGLLMKNSWGYFVAGGAGPWEGSWLGYFGSDADARKAWSSLDLIPQKYRVGPKQPG